MRPIDADALKEAFYNRHRTPDDVKYLRVPAEAVYQFIDNAPTVKRPKGEWIKVVENLSWHYECNQCHNKPLMARLVDEDVLSDFCPNCGADMRGGAE